MCGEKSLLCPFSFFGDASNIPRISLLSPRPFSPYAGSMFTPCSSDGNIKKHVLYLHTVEHRGRTDRHDFPMSRNKKRKPGKWKKKGTSWHRTTRKTQYHPLSLFPAADRENEATQDKKYYLLHSHVKRTSSCFPNLFVKKGKIPVKNIEPS